MSQSFSWAALDIFDQPTLRERKKKVEQTEDRARLLDYPKECLLKGNYEAAFNNCQKLVNYQPAKNLKGEILYLMGLSCLKLGRFIEARSYFNDVVLIKDAAEELKASAYLGIADSYFLEENFEKAFEAYKQFLASYPVTEVGALVYFRLGEILYKMGRSEEAKYYFDKLKNEYPLSFEARLSNGFVDKKEFYSIQVGCFNEEENADRFCKKLLGERFDAYISESQGSNEPRFRVMVGRFNSKDEAETLEAELKSAGYSTKIQK